MDEHAYLVDTAAQPVLDSTALFGVKVALRQCQQMCKVPLAQQLAEPRLQLVADDPADIAKDILSEIGQEDGQHAPHH